MDVKKEQLQPHGKHIPRRQCIPILYTKGTYYEVGFDTGRTFAAIIRSFVELSDPLNKGYLPIYNTPAGRAVYIATLQSVKESFPQYVRELEGIADGSGVEFHKLMLLHLDEIITVATKSGCSSVNEPIGCSTLCVNETNCEVIAHTEDARIEVLNHYYVVCAHIIEPNPQGKYKISEERFTSLCYAGHLPGYNVSYNYDGLVFTVNTLNASTLHSGKTPRHFITRALLCATNFEQAEKILRDNGVGAADGCSINISFLKENNRPMYNIEMGPAAPGENQSQLDVLKVRPGESYARANKYLRLPIEEAGLTDSSDARHRVFERLGKPKTMEDVLNILGDESDPVHTVFRTGGKDSIYSVCVGIFDCKKETWTLYSDNPKYNEPLVVLPLVFKR